MYTFESVLLVWVTELFIGISSLETFESVLLVRVSELFIGTVHVGESWVASGYCAVMQARLGRFTGAAVGFPFSWAERVWTLVSRL